jgi:hypothetical protein
MGMAPRGWNLESDPPGRSLHSPQFAVTVPVEKSSLTINRSVDTLLTHGRNLCKEDGLLLVRELDERLKLSSLIGEDIVDGRQGKNTQLPLLDLLRQFIYSRLAGYGDVNDAEWLSR